MAVQLNILRTAKTHSPSAGITQCRYVLLVNEFGH